MFDSVICLYTLPWPEVQDASWQTQSTREQYLEHYEVRQDGTLWHEACDAKWVDDSDGILGFRIERENIRWEQVIHDGEIEIHTLVDKGDGSGHIWYSVLFWFRDGTVRDAIFKKVDSEKKAKP